MKINLVHILLLEVSEIDGKIAKAIIERKLFLSIPLNHLKAQIKHHSHDTWSAKDC